MLLVNEFIEQLNSLHLDILEKTEKEHPYYKNAILCKVEFRIGDSIYVTTKLLKGKKPIYLLTDAAESTFYCNTKSIEKLIAVIEKEFRNI